MMRRWMLFFVSIIIAATGTAFTRNLPPGPDRYTFITVKYTAYNWYLAAWKDQTPLCSIIVDHQGLPFPGEVYRDCGKTIYSTWIVQKPCNVASPRDCAGYYVVYVNNEPAEKEMPIELLSATAWISLEGCQPVLSAGTNICEKPPTLVITGQEPLPGESIVRIEGTYDGRSFDCNGSVCRFEIPETKEEGVQVEFWSYSSYGDSSIVYSAQVRVQKLDEGDPDQYYWYADVLSSQWQGSAVATCSDAWNVFPPVGGAPEWLTTPTQSQQLSSDIPYTYLAANLILQGAADASSCADGGVLPDGSANQCGLEASRPAVTEWQNRFDELILSTAAETAVPARLLKNLFARESQFWPGSYQGREDAGFGQLTENGADTTLFWNAYFYAQFCPLVMDAETCSKGYIHLTNDEQIELRRALVRSVNASCENCPLGIDLAQADYSIGVFGHTMIANCEQTGQVIENYTDKIPGDVASYENLWKFTLVNYNAGGGCLAEAVSAAFGAKLELTWENVSPFLAGTCASAIDYVNDISK